MSVYDQDSPDSSIFWQGRIVVADPKEAPTDWLHFAYYTSRAERLAGFLGVVPAVDGVLRGCLEFFRRFWLDHVAADE